MNDRARDDPFRLWWPDIVAAGALGVVAGFTAGVAFAVALAVITVIPCH